MRARLRIEEALRDGFSEAYHAWKKQAEEDQSWAGENLFCFNVVKTGHDFHIDTVFGSSAVSAV